MAVADAFRLQYTWKIEASIDRVFHLLGHVTTFPKWWGAVFLAAESDATDPFVGARARGCNGSSGRAEDLEDGA